MSKVESQGEYLQYLLIRFSVPGARTYSVRGRGQDEIQCISVFRYREGLEEVAKRRVLGLAIDL